MGGRSPAATKREPHGGAQDHGRNRSRGQDGLAACWHPCAFRGIWNSTDTAADGADIASPPPCAPTILCDASHSGIKQRAAQHEPIMRPVLATAANRQPPSDTEWSQTSGLGIPGGAGNGRRSTLQCRSCPTGGLRSLAIPQPPIAGRFDGSAGYPVAGRGRLTAGRPERGRVIGWVVRGAAARRRSCWSCR